MIAVLRPGEVDIREMLHADLSAVAGIEAHAYDYPWNESVFRDCLLAGYKCIVLESEGVLRGYAIMSVAAAEAHILNLCIDPDWQRQGFGRQLLDYLLAHSKRRSVERMFLEVRPSNAAAIGLYLGAGFEELGVRREYYRASEGREDAVVFVYYADSAG